ncbi:MAG: sensor histidine kinase, partial [[Eubacterium] siraeum]|nr:sensor histidine kinase [[Eubacterium] siraeum]
MNGWKRAFGLICLFIAAVFAGVNVFFSRSSTDGGRPYRVEAERIALEITENGAESVDLQNYRYICGITKQGDNFYSSDCDYIICEVDGELYRLDY